MATNTAALKTFAQQTRSKLLSLIGTKMDFVLTQDNAELRGYETQIGKLKEAVNAKLKDVDEKSKNPIADARKLVTEEVAYTWFNRVMALRFMDANGYNTPMVVTAAAGQMRPELLQDAMAGSVDEDLRITSDDLMLPEAQLYRCLLVAVCNKWGETMPFLFEHICDYTELLLPDDLLSDQSFVSDIRKGMTDEDCQNVEIMGWLYQFYITDRKNDAEKKKSKKGGLKSDEQAAATQLFTPHWVVRYMVENSLGRIWMTLHPGSTLQQKMPYYIPTPEGQTDTIPEDIHSAADIHFIDPCCGSGHVLVYAFDLFCKMYEEEGYTSRDIPTAILTNNLYGLDIDRRCYQLASFALTMKARAYHSRYLRRPVQPNILALQNIDEDTIASTGNWDKKSTMWQFVHVDTIGSLLQISTEECARIKVSGGLFGEKQQVLKKQAEYLSSKYHCVVTNPPYLGKGMGDDLKLYSLINYPITQIDTMAMFMERCHRTLIKNGYFAMINQASWMFKSNYSDFRKTLIDQQDFNFNSILYLGPNTFEEIKGEVVQSVCFVSSKRNQQNTQCFYLKRPRTSEGKKNEFIENINRYKNIDIKSFMDFKNYQFGFWMNKSVISCCSKSPISNYGDAKQGLKTGDNSKFIRLWFEISNNKIQSKWFHVETGGDFRKWYGNGVSVLDWENDGFEIKNFKFDNGKLRSRPQGLAYSFKKGLTWTTSAGERPSFRYSDNTYLFESAGSKFFLHSNEEYLPLFAAFLNSNVCKIFIEIFSPGIGITEGAIKSLPFISISNKEDLNLISAENISISKLDWDAHETSWDFQQNELIRLQKEGLGLVTATIEDTPVMQYYRLDLLMTEYKSYWADKFKQLHANEEELNHQFIEIYGLQDELTPDVPLSEITILQKGEISIEDNEIVWHEDVIIKQLISYLVGCFMGRYSVDKPGLIIASQHQDLNALGVKVDGIDDGAPGRLVIDDDGIVPILNGEYFSDDMTVRIEQAIKVLFGEDTFQENLRYIDAKLCKPLREYLFKDFFNDHIDGKMYQKRPIYWLFSSKMGDRRKKGHFKALVYMHRIEPDTLSKLHADYVVPYIDKIEQQQQEAEDQTLRDDLSQAQRNKARKAADELSEQLHEVKDFEQILVQMASQRISIDLDDGVRKNYPKFYPLVEPIKGLEKKK
ncbi:MAG: BREX-1 system adenine-specific DNA-methyltransferase PglX [Prevotella sp.]